MLQLEIGNFAEAENNVIVCLKHFKKQKDKLGQAAVYGILGIIYFKSGQFQKSIQNYNLAYEIYDTFHQIQEQITCLIGIGNNFIKLNQFDEACEIFLECSALCSDNKDIYNLLDCLGNLITLYEKQENWDIVYELYKKSLKAFKELDDVKGTITSYFNLGILKKKESDFNQAIIYFKKGTNKAIESSYTELILKGLSYVGEILVYQGEMNEAKETYIKALSIAENIKEKNSILQIRILLNSLGLDEEEINKELTIYMHRRKN
ncbi:MAG: tetratricopeptide repeat protein [Promethearchaeota archaeon]